MNIVDEAYKIYTAYGQCAVHDAVKAGRLPCDGWAYCAPCETESSMLDGECLVCGEHND
jgi:hypothetical protein